MSGLPPNPPSPSLAQHGEIVTFEAQIDAEFSADKVASVGQQPEDEAVEFPHDIKIYCLDDSASARRLLYHNLTKWAHSTNVHVYGEDETEVDQFTSAALAHADIVILDQVSRDPRAVPNLTLLAKILFEARLC